MNIYDPFPSDQPPTGLVVDGPYNPDVEQFAKFAPGWWGSWVSVPTVLSEDDIRRIIREEIALYGKRRRAKKDTD